MKRLLALALCLVTLLPAAARAGEREDGDGYDRGRERHGRDRGEYREERGRREFRHRRDAGHRRHGGTEFLLGAGFAGVTDSRNHQDMFGSGHHGNRLDGGLAVDLGVRHWFTPMLGLGIEAGYHGLGRGGMQDGGIMPLTGTPVPGIGPPPDSWMQTRHDHLYVIPITAVATFRALPYAAVHPYLKAGAGAYLVHGSQEIGDVAAQRHRDLEARFGGFGGGGLEFRSHGMSYGIEGAWHMVDAAQGDFDHLTLSVGVRFR